MVPGVVGGDGGNFGIRIATCHSNMLYFVKKA